MAGWDMRDMSGWGHGCRRSHVYAQHVQRSEGWSPDGCVCFWQAKTKEKGKKKKGGGGGGGEGGKVASPSVPPAAGGAACMQSGSQG